MAEDDDDDDNNEGGVGAGQEGGPAAAAAGRKARRRRGGGAGPVCVYETRVFWDAGGGEAVAAEFSESSLSRMDRILNRISSHPEYPCNRREIEDGGGSRVIPKADRESIMSNRYVLNSAPSFMSQFFILPSHRTRTLPLPSSHIIRFFHVGKFESASIDVLLPRARPRQRSLL